jgi:CubicO group peptidase (beta-lactamase class C family)
MYQKEHLAMNIRTIIDRLARPGALMCLALLIGLTAATVRAAPAPAPPASLDIAAIDAYVDAQMRDLRIPGLALGIVQGEEIVHLKGFGVADPGGRAVTPQTPFIIGSTTKSFTALAVMQLVEAGKVDLDAPIQRYLPNFRVADSDASADITVRHLLNQTSGISSAAGNADFTRDDAADDALEQRARALQTVQLTQPVGATFQYANANYDLLGLLVQTVSGQPYEDYIQQQIFAPLEMRHAYTAPAAAQSDGLATGYHYWFGVPAAMATPFPRGTLPSGYLIASVEDMSHYLIAQLNDGRYRDATVLSAPGIAALHRPAVAAFDGNQYAMGWLVGQSGGVPSVWHNGTVPGFNANMVLAPSQRWGVVALMNASSQIDEVRKEAIVDGVISLLHGRAPQPTPANQIVVVLYAVIMVIAAIPLINVIWSALALRRWRTNPSSRPRRWRLVWRVASVWAPNLLVALLFLLVQPRLFGIGLRGTLLLSPDIGTVMIASSVIALGWCVVYPLLLWQLLRARLAPRTISSPARG